MAWVKNRFSSCSPAARSRSLGVEPHVADRFAPRQHGGSSYLSNESVPVCLGYVVHSWWNNREQTGNQRMNVLYAVSKGRPFPASGESHGRSGNLRALASVLSLAQFALGSTFGFLS